MRDRAVRPSLLIVDDEPSVLFFLVSALRGDFDVAEATTAEEALTLLEARPFALMVTDKNLPGIDGVELARRARKLRPELRSVLITGYPSFASVADAIDAGIADYLAKPFFDIDDLRARIRKAAKVAPPPEPAPTRKRVDIYEPEHLSALRFCDAVKALGLEAQVRAATAGWAVDPPRAAIFSWDFAPDVLALARSLGAPFIIATREVNFEIAVEALRGGAVACVPKNLGDAGALARQIKRALRLP